VLHFTYYLRIIIDTPFRELMGNENSNPLHHQKTKTKTISKGNLMFSSRRRRRMLILISRRNKSINMISPSVKLQHGIFIVELECIRTNKRFYLSQKVPPPFKTSHNSKMLQKYGSPTT